MWANRQKNNNLFSEGKEQAKNISSFSMVEDWQTGKQANIFFVGVSHLSRRVPTDMYLYDHLWFTSFPGEVFHSFRPIRNDSRSIWWQGGSNRAVAPWPMGGHPWATVQPDFLPSHAQSSHNHTSVSLRAVFYLYIKTPYLQLFFRKFQIFFFKLPQFGHMGSDRPNTSSVVLPQSSELPGTFTRTVAIVWVVDEGAWYLRYSSSGGETFGQFFKKRTNYWISGGMTQVDKNGSDHPAWNRRHSIAIMCFEYFMNFSRDFVHPRFDFIFPASAQNGLGTTCLGQ